MFPVEHRPVPFRWCLITLIGCLAGKSFADECPYCPPSCLAAVHTCHNTGNRSSEPDPVTNECDCAEGYEGTSCQSCATDAGCGSSSKGCSHSVIFHDEHVAYHECKLETVPLLQMLGDDDRPGVEGIAHIEWTKPSGWSNPKKDGIMYFQFYRKEPSNYLLEFFACRAKECTVSFNRRKAGEGKLEFARRVASGEDDGDDGDDGGDDPDSDGKDTPAPKYSTPDFLTSHRLSAVGWVIAGLLVGTSMVLCAAGFVKNGKHRKHIVTFASIAVFVELVALIGTNCFDMKEIIDKQGLNAGEYLEVVYSCEDVSSDGLGCDCSASDAHDKDEWTPKCANSPFQNLLLGVKDTLHVVCDNQTDANTHADCAFYSDSLLAGFPILLDCKTSQCVTDSSESLDLLMPETKNTVLHVVIAGFSVAVFAVVVHCIYSMYSSLQLMQEWRQRYVTAGEPQGEAVAPQFAMHEAGELSPTSPTPASRSPGIRLGTRLLSYHIGYGSTAKTILNKVTLDVPEGQSLAIMGPSGAGKTTLLDILAAREKRGVLSGCVMINGEPVCGRKLTNLYRDIVGYVSQDDTLIPSLTVFESVLYSARLRLPAGMPDRVKKAKVDDVIASLGLTQCKDTKIGGPRERGISGGERRRVSIAMELVANPRVLFLDEPTSGLDSYNALIVMQTIARLKTSSCTTQFASFFDYQTAIVFSIHQPSKEIYDTFDNLLLLSKGHLLYCGSAAAAVDTCAALGYRAPDSISNPADFLLKMASTLSLDERSALSRAATARILSLSNSGHAGKREGVQSGSFGDSIVELMSEAGSFDEHTLMMDESIRRPIESRDANSRIQTRKGSIPAPLLEALENRKYYVNFYQELLIVGQRGYQSLMGSYYLVMCHIVVTMVLGGVLLLFYSRQPLGLSGIMNRSGCLTFTMLLLGFSSLSALELFLIERDVYVRERNNRYYGSLSYFLTKIMYDILPLRILPPLFLGAVTYNQMGLRTDNPVYFLTFLYVLVLFNIITAGISFNAAMITPSFGGGVLFASLLMLTFFAFNPLIVQGDTLPESVAWLRFISPFFLSFEALMVNELHGQQCTFAPTTASGEPSDSPIPILCEQYLSNLGLRVDRFGYDIGMLQLWAAVYLVIAWLGLTWFVREKR
ncbi:putative ATP-dependent permease [Diplonema papillatum]|nr:putative ATP-dependent permease [Diplonema papillatum]